MSEVPVLQSKQINGLLSPTSPGAESVVSSDGEGSVTSRSVSFDLKVSE